MFVTQISREQKESLERSAERRKLLTLSLKQRFRKKTPNKHLYKPYNDVYWVTPTWKKRSGL